MVVEDSGRQIFELRPAADQNDIQLVGPERQKLAALVLLSTPGLTALGTLQSVPTSSWQAGNGIWLTIKVSRAQG